MLLLIKILNRKKNVLISLDLMKVLQKGQYKIKCVFLNPVMTKALTAEYNPNDMIVVVIAESGEQ